jgi:hypothetical protein
MSPCAARGVRWWGFLPSEGASSAVFLRTYEALDGLSLCHSLHRAT